MSEVNKMSDQAVGAMIIVTMGCLGMSLLATGIAAALGMHFAGSMMIIMGSTLASFPVYLAMLAIAGNVR